MAGTVDLIADLNATKLSWSLVVGVVRLYEFPSQWNENEVFSLEMVLQDVKGDRIHATISKPALEAFRHQIKEHAIYKMQNFIVTTNNGKFRPFAELESNGASDENLLFDYIGEVVGKEEARGIITRTGHQSKRIALQLEDLDKNKIKCTLFGELVDQVLPQLERDDGEPFILVVQLFKTNVYLNSLNIQSAYYVSKVYFNLNLTEINEFKQRLNKDIIFLHNALLNFRSNLNTLPRMRSMQEMSCWIIANIVSLEVGKDDWCYTSCKTCPKKVVESKDRYWCDHCRRVGFKAMLRLQIIVTDGTGCLKLIVWNKEAEQMVGKLADKVNEICMWEKTNSYPKYLDNVIDKRFLFKLNITYKNINAIEGVYSVTKLSDEDFLISSFGCASSSVEASTSQIMGHTSLSETQDDSNAHGVVSLSKDSAVEINGDSSYQTPAKRSSPDTVDGYIGEAIVSADAQASANKTFRWGYYEAV
ncbi:replication protein A 70 kDa DNA-binding subunit B-like [Arachis hypogaea]|uniref:replication protein A 70 kDa DNA-binding subunit B-like n=1 Tax=Arachis hypogaea TaxID=3818 RepID=UPI003B226D99